YKLEFVTSGKHQTRDVMFLLPNGNKIDAEAAYKKLKNPILMLLNTRFEAWQSWINNKRWYHGWNLNEYSGKYTECFVFKCDENKRQHRFYGFLCHPKKISNPRYCVCILVGHAFKKEKETDELELKRVEE